MLIVHLKIYIPGTILVTEILNCVGSVIAGKLGPVTSVHKPVPGEGLFPFRLVKLALQRFCDAPAFAVTMLLERLTATSAELPEHEPLLNVHLRI